MCGRAGVYFSVYEATKRVLCPDALQAGEDEPMWVVAVGGATTGAITWLVSEHGAFPYAGRRLTESILLLCSQ
eukprot:COSAG05_NODE_980_length_6311_cov_21.873632_5_plen_73_part_00